MGKENDKAIKREMLFRANRGGAMRVKSSQSSLVLKNGGTTNGGKWGLKVRGWELAEGERWKTVSRHEAGLAPTK